MHSIVKYHDLLNNTTYTVQLVFPEDVDDKNLKISIFSPIATLLLGSKKGQVLDAMLPNGRTRIKVEEIIYQPEAAGDYHL
jgi:regulator of nucleoside diphosphate kinase